MTNNERSILLDALRIYGTQSQITMVFEEMAELQKELCKFLRGSVDGESLARIAEEIADVEIMLDQMKLEFRCADAVRSAREAKIERLKGRLEQYGG